MNAADYAAQIARQCAHYDPGALLEHLADAGLRGTPRAYGRCRSGVRYADLDDPLPCISRDTTNAGATACAKRQPITLADAQHIADRRLRTDSANAKAAQTIAHWRTTGRAADVIACPACGEPFCISRSTASGSVHAICTADECVRWIE